MIKENEIRIGNWVVHNANWCYRSPAEIKPFYFQWSDRDWYALGECTMDLEDLSPIQISPEILEKAGFIKIEGKQGIYQTIEGQYQIAFFEGRNAVFYIRYDEFRGYCYLNGLLFYVHQLQNLYFALSGEELTITL